MSQHSSQHNTTPALIHMTIIHSLQYLTTDRQTNKQTNNSQLLSRHGTRLSVFHVYVFPSHGSENKLRGWNVAAECEEHNFFFLSLSSIEISTLVLPKSRDAFMFFSRQSVWGGWGWVFSLFCHSLDNE